MARHAGLRFLVSAGRDAHGTLRSRGRVIDQLLYAVGGSSSTIALATNERFSP